MEYKDFIKLFKERKHRTNKFKNYSIKELCQIMTFIEQKLKTENGNWAIKNIDVLAKECKTKSIYVFFNLQDFYKQYSKRKKSVKMFESVLNKFEVKREKERQKKYSEFNNKKQLFEIKDKSQILDLLSDLKKIKKKYLNGIDDDFVKLISDKIKTGYKKNTLRKYYYDC